jgi:hypothetical protein
LLLDALNADTTLSPKKRIHGFLDGMYRLYTKQPNPIGCPLGHAAGDSDGVSPAMKEKALKMLQRITSLFDDLPPKARQIMVASAMKVHQLLIDNLAAARGARDDNDSLVGLIITFFGGICLEQNFGPDRARITKKIEAFMRLIRGI